MIREVWAENLEEEIKIMSDLIVDFPYIAMDTEFPGVVAKPAGCWDSTEELEYQAMRCNVDILKIIQIGITLGNENGDVPTPVSTWQFNFKFDLDKDPYFSRAISLLVQSGINFKRFKEEGIDVYDFGRLLIPSGLVLSDKVTWVSFHSISDFGYLLKVLTCKPLPKTNSEFFESLNTYFPRFYDIKYFSSTKSSLANGLQGIADQLGVERVGQEHQAGSDALVTLKVFFELKKQIFGIGFSDIHAENKLFGVSPPPLTH